MNRSQRRARAKGAAAKRALPKCVNPAGADLPSTEVCDGVCRACSRRRQLFLPGRVCGPCIETAIALAMEMTPEQATAALAELERMEMEEDPCP